MEMTANQQEHTHSSDTGTNKYADLCQFLHHRIAQLIPIQGSGGNNGGSSEGYQSETQRDIYA